jgi:hypothetical protein
MRMGGSRMATPVVPAGPHLASSRIYADLGRTLVAAVLTGLVQHSHHVLGDCVAVAESLCASSS